MNDSPVTNTPHSPSPLSRRRFLRGTGALVALPVLESLLPRTARGANTATVKPPVRLGVFTVAGGTVLESWKPAAVGPLESLPSILRPLAAHRSELLLLSGLAQSGESFNLNAHEHCAFLHFTAADKVGKENGRIVSQVSFDQVAADHCKEQSLLPSLEMGYVSGEQRFSFRPGGIPIPYEEDPRIAFERMFRGRRLVAPNWKRRLGEPAATPATASAVQADEKTVVDLVLADAKSLHKDLSGGDRQKLAEYLESVQTIERRIERTQRRLAAEALDWNDPGPSNPHAPQSLPKNQQEVQKLTRLVTRDPEVHGEYIRLMAQLMVLAFQTDTTRVCTLGLGSDEALFPGVVTVGYERHAHTLEHQGNAARVEDADPISREACRQIHAWYTLLFAETIAQMRAIPEGDGTLLDNCLIMYTSYMANGGHGRENYPVLLAGRAGGTLRPGRHIAYQTETPVANLYVEILNRMGLVLDRFGNSHTSAKAAYNGRLPDLV